MAAKIGIEPESALADVDRSPRRPNALLVQARSVLAVGKSRGRATGIVGCLLKFGLAGGALCIHRLFGLRNADPPLATFCFMPPALCSRVSTIPVFERMLCRFATVANLQAGRFTGMTTCGSVAGTG